jgi:hypothetical protein
MTLGTEYRVFVVLSPVTAIGDVHDGEIDGISQAVLTEALNAQETFVFTLKIDDLWVNQIVLSQTVIQVTRNSVFLWQGIITNMISDGKVMTYTVQDYGWLFTKRHVAPLNGAAFYSTRFQPSTTNSSWSYEGVGSVRAPIYANTFANKASAALLPLPNASVNSWVAKKNGVPFNDTKWGIQVNETTDIVYDNTSSPWTSYTYKGPNSSGVQSAVTETVQLPNIYAINTATMPPGTDSIGTLLTPYSDNWITEFGSTTRNYESGSAGSTANAYLDAAKTALVRGGGIGTKLFRQFIFSNNEKVAKTLHAVVYVRLNWVGIVPDPASSMTATTNASSATGHVPNTFSNPVPAIVKFGITNNNRLTDDPYGWTDWVQVAYIDTNLLPSGEWVRLSLSLSLPALTSNINVALGFYSDYSEAATVFATTKGPYGYLIGGADVLLDDGLFYRQEEQQYIVQDLINYVTSPVNGWDNLPINVTIDGLTGQLRTKQYLFSDYQTAYDALWEFTTYLGGYDFGWEQIFGIMTFRGYYSVPSPGITVGTVLGKGSIKSTELRSGFEIANFSITADGTQLSDVVSVYEAATATIEGAARDVATVSSVPSGRWILAEIFEGTPGGGSLTLKSQAQRGYNRYSQPAFSLTITLDPKQTTVIFTHVVGDVIYVTIPVLNISKLQFRIVGRTTTLATDITTLNIQQYYGI